MESLFRRALCASKIQTISDEDEGKRKGQRRMSVLPGGLGIRREFCFFQWHLPA